MCTLLFPSLSLILCQCLSPTLYLTLFIPLSWCACFLLCNCSAYSSRRWLPSPGEILCWSTFEKNKITGRACVRTAWNACAWNDPHPNESLLKVWRSYVIFGPEIQNLSMVQWYDLSPFLIHHRICFCCHSSSRLALYFVFHAAGG